MIPSVTLGKKPEKEFRFTKSKEGFIMRLPARLRVNPNKYNPGKGKVIKNKPYCYQHREEKTACKSCMWRFNCD